MWESHNLTFMLLMATRNPARKPVEVSSFSHYLQDFSTILLVVCFLARFRTKPLRNRKPSSRGRACSRDGGGGENLKITRDAMTGPQPKKKNHPRNKGPWWVFKVFCPGIVRLPSYVVIPGMWYTAWGQKPATDGRIMIIILVGVLFNHKLLQCFGRAQALYNYARKKVLPSVFTWLEPKDANWGMKKGPLVVV